MTGDIDTAAKRSKLPPRKNPYWRGVSGGRGGLSLGYRRPAKGEGSWIAKIVVDGRRAEERIGAVDDGERSIPGALSYPLAVAAALTWGRQQSAILEASRDATALAAIPTVRSAVQTYITVRQARYGRRGTELQLKSRLFGYGALADLRLSKLTAKPILVWRTQLPQLLAPASRNRLIADLRAALNAAAEKHHHELPTNILVEIKAGTRPEELITAARKQLLTEVQVRKVVEAAFEAEPDEDFGKLVLLAAVTGARFSQLAALRVADVQPDNSRIMMPGSRKGRKRKSRTYAAVPVDDYIIERLAIAGRGADEPLLMRWAYRRISGPRRWEKQSRRGWRFAYEVEKMWAKTVELSGVPAGTIMYALRHSSIVRRLVARLPVRMVAALHDTSTEMIEKHYSAYILDVTEGLARETVMAFGPSPPSEQILERRNEGSAHATLGV